MSKPVDKELYEKVKKKVYSQYKVHSAYRSSALVKAYKEAFEKKHGDKKAYTGKKDKTSGLSRWHQENWRTQEGKTTYQKKGDIFRPTVKVSKKTPTTFKELSKKEIESAKREKAKKGRVKRFKS